MATLPEDIHEALGLRDQKGINRGPTVPTAANAMQTSGVSANNPYSGMTTATNYGTKRKTSDQASQNSLPTQATQPTTTPSTNIPWWEQAGASYAYQQPPSADQIAKAASWLATEKTQSTQQDNDINGKTYPTQPQITTTTDTEDEENKPPTEREKLAAEHQGLISGDNILAIQNQLDRQLDSYDLADRQNRELAKRQMEQNSRKNEADRFEAQRDLQAAALGLFGSMGNAMNGSALGNLRTMLDQRNDKENNTYWAQLRANQDAVRNSLQDSFNQNVLARREAMQSAEKAIRDVESDWAANLNNIHPELFQQGAVNGIGHLSSTTAWADHPGGVPGSVDWYAANRPQYLLPQTDSGYYYNAPIYYSSPIMSQYDYYGRR